MPIASYLNQKLKRKSIPSTFDEALEMCNDITEAGDYLVGRTESKSKNFYQRNSIGQL